jgi:type IV pilus assembly protein PilB
MELARVMEDLVAETTAMPDFDEEIDQLEVESADEEIDLENLERMSEDAPVVKLVNVILVDALRRGASDIHIEPYEKEFRVRFRMDGVLYNIMAPPMKMRDALTSRMKIMARLDIAEKRLPQDGRIKIRVRLDGRSRELDFRVSTLPTIFGEKIVLRLLDKENLRLDMTQLGFERESLEKFKRNINKPYGMVLVTGPTGSGKTTTLYAGLNEIKNEEDKIITIEDPVEYQLVGVTQIPVNEKKGLTFARGLRSILRHDPDKIMVGEIRDSETAQIAIQSALTGHLVFTTVHANNVIDVIGRFLNMGVEPYNFVSSLNCVLAQRLVRMLCVHCKRAYRPVEQELSESGLNPEKYGDQVFYNAVGCEVCNFTGYRGRTAIHELLDVTDHIREIILERRPGSEVRRAARAEGLTSLRESALAKVFLGVTTLHEINRVTFVE